MNLKDIQKVIGTPKENRDFMVKALLSDLNLKCKQCDTAYPDWNGMNNLTITHYADAENPRQMTCAFVCSCGHSGGHTFKPNPFMPPYTYSPKGYGY